MLLVPSYWLGKYFFQYWTHSCKTYGISLKKRKALKPAERHKQDREDCCNSFCQKHVVYSAVYYLMILSYLLGDNLKQMVCDTMDSKVNSTECGLCPSTAQFFTGLSLLLSLALIAWSGAEKGKLPSAFPVVSKREEVYNNLMQIAASAVTIDQALTAILEHISKSTTKCIRVFNSDIGRETAFLTMYGALVVVVILSILVLLVHKYWDTFKCCDQKGKRPLVLLQWVFAIWTLFFIVAFLFADIDYFWDLINGRFPNSVNTTRILRAFLLSLSIATILLFMGVYIVGICIPGLGYVLGRKRSLLEEHDILKASEKMVRDKYMTWQKEKKKGEEKNKTARSDKTAGSDKASGLDETAQSEETAVSGETVRSKSTTEPDDKSKVDSKVTVKDDVGKATISFTFKEEAPDVYCKGFQLFCDEMMIPNWSLPVYDDDDDDKGEKLLRRTMRVEVVDVKKLKDVASSAMY